MWPVYLADTISVYQKEVSSEMDLRKADKYGGRDKLQKVYGIRSTGNFAFLDKILKCTGLDTDFLVFFSNRRILSPIKHLR